MGLFDPIWKTKNMIKKNEAINVVKKMSGDQRKLVQVAKTAYLDEVRFAAICMITDDEALYDIALKEDGLKNSIEAINRIQDYSVLERIARESSDEYLINRCKERLICGDIDFNSISTEETVGFFAKLDCQSFDIFDKTNCFDIALKRFFDDDFCVHFSQVSEEIAKKIWVRFLLKYCKYYGINQSVRGYFDEESIKRFAPEFKKIWNSTPYKSFKDLLSQYIWPYSVEVAEYMLLNNVKINHLDHFLLARYESGLIEMVDNPDVLRFALENSYNEKIRELADKKLKHY